MRPLTLAALCLALALPISGCKIIRKSEADSSAIASDASGDAARTEELLASTFDAELLPLIRNNAVPVADLRAALAQGLDAAGAKFGQKGAGQGAAWNFPLGGTGKIVEANLKSGARTIGVDTDGDTKVDVVLQLGPVIRGTALRDVAPFYNFDGFRDQMEFAKLARAINDRIKATYMVPDGNLVGQTVAFSGVVALKSADEAMLVTPISLDFEP